MKMQDIKKQWAEMLNEKRAKTKNFKLISVSIIISEGRAFLPTMVKFDQGGFFIVEPVYIVDLTLNALTEVIIKIHSEGHKLVTQPPRYSTEKTKDPVLSATKKRSWKELAKTGQNYDITWTNEKITVDRLRKDKKGRWVFDIVSRILYPDNTTIESIVNAILEDLKIREIQ